MNITSSIVLAAGRGQRLSPITDLTPKPLLKVGKDSLIRKHLNALVKAGMQKIVVNVSHLGDQIINELSDIKYTNVNISFSQEPSGALETGGGIFNALKHIDDETFLVVNSDIYTDFDFKSLPSTIDGLAHLILVPNPDHKTNGDFFLDRNKIVNSSATVKEKNTYSGIGILKKSLFDNEIPGHFPLAPLLKRAANNGQVTGEIYVGQWIDVGTIERLILARNQVAITENN
tara:strand:+ start:250 stop:942 length:693 start_codon:yes stop_codon:yes gene_type:complete